MRYIIKGQEPRFLIEHRLKNFANYNNYEQKDELRDFLLKEQGYLCCYCMKRIRLNDMKIEHWACQDFNPDLQLSYRNMFGACLGNEGQPWKKQTCDSKKKNTTLNISPLNKNQVDLIKYTSNGVIFHSDPQIDDDLNNVLNLNNQSDKNNRKSVIDDIVKYLTKRYSNTWTKAILSREIAKWDKCDESGEFKVYCEIALYYLKKRYRKA